MKRFFYDLTWVFIMFQLKPTPLNLWILAELADNIAFQKTLIITIKKAASFLKQLLYYLKSNN